MSPLSTAQLLLRDTGDKNNEFPGQLSYNERVLPTARVVSLALMLNGSTSLLLQFSSCLECYM